MKSFGKYEKVRDGIINKGGIYQPIFSTPSKEWLREIVAFTMSRWEESEVKIYCCKLIFPFIAMSIPEMFHGCKVEIIPIEKDIPLQIFVCPKLVDIFSEDYSKKFLIEPAVLTNCYDMFWVGRKNINEYMETGTLS